MGAMGRTRNRVAFWVVASAVGCSSPVATPKPSVHPPPLVPSVPAKAAASPDVGPAALTRNYLDQSAKLEPEQRAQLLGALVDTHDERIEPAVRLALSEFVANQTDDVNAPELLPALRAVQELKLQSCRDLLLQTFLKVRGSTALGSSVWHALPLAMAEVADASWVPALSQKLTEPLVPTGADRAEADQSYWQLTAISVLARLREPSSLDALVNVLTDPEKKGIRSAIRRALLGFGRPAFQRGLALLRESDERRVREGGMLVGGLGLAEGTGPLLQALRSAKSPETKVRLALELPRLPANAEALAAFRQVFEKTPPGTSLRDEPGPPLAPHEAFDKMADAVSGFQDSALVPWLLLQVDRAPVNISVPGFHRSRLLFAAMRLATPAQWPSVARAVEKFGSTSDRQFAKSCAQALNECGEDLVCYQKLLTGPASPDNPDAARFAGLKAAHRIAQLGTPKTAEELAMTLGNVRDWVVVGGIVGTIDHLLPLGSPFVENELAQLMAPGGRGSTNGLPVHGQETLSRLRARSASPTPAP